VQRSAGAPIDVHNCTSWVRRNILQRNRNLKQYLRLGCKPRLTKDFFASFRLPVDNFVNKKSKTLPKRLICLGKLANRKDSGEEIPAKSIGYRKILVLDISTAKFLALRQGVNKCDFAFSSSALAAAERMHGFHHRGD
jgi:hypothetical protein